MLTPNETPAPDGAHDLEPLQDLTQPLTLRSKRTERRRRKLEKKGASFRRSSSARGGEPIGVLDLPVELLVAILELVRPSDLFALSRVSRQLRAFLLADEAAIAHRVVSLRYPILQRCLLRPLLMTDVDSSLWPLLRMPDRPDLNRSHLIAHHNIPPPDDAFHCTCLTCIVRWNALCAVVDFAHWQRHLDNGVPIPMIPRGAAVPSWNRDLLDRHRRVVLKALTSPLWYARVLEAHLASTTRSIRRHSQNKSDRRRHFLLTQEDEQAGTDAFLQRNGPPTFDYPYSRELYYMLEAFLPGRSWLAEHQKWVYLSSGGWHDHDLDMLAKMVAARGKRDSGTSIQSCCAHSDHGDSPGRSLWDAYEVPKCPLVEVTEVWVEEGEDSSALVETRNISSQDIDSWLEEPSRRSFPDGHYARSVRLLWVGQNREMKRASPSTKTLERLTEVWGLGEALDYARCCYAGVSALEPTGNTQLFTAAYHPKLAAAWSHTERRSRSTPPHTNAIIFAEGEERAELRRILSSKWSSASAKHAMFPALLCSLMLAHSLDTTLEEIKAAVREVEARTGHHRFASRHQTQPAAGELGQLSAQMSGCAAKLANGARKREVIQAINDFISQHAAWRPAADPRRRQATDKDATPGGGALFSAAQLDLLRHRAQMQAVDTAYVQQRVQIQIAALFHLIAQQDNAIAFDTAKATRSIAASSLQDSSSMKMLALVAMFFLPGSFIAALFSTPLFVWDDTPAGGGAAMGAVRARPQLGLFWAIVAPLTALVFVLYGIWMCVQARRERNKRHNAADLEVV
ncbi:hypothetical protein C8A05DRAFT_12113 [Staphylotrichum tortipilum]|uniref:F-box domain-containing protein n=1 Tax=Staphylotrichum tortipilum TaxID=2831512 RepID=A0AAN6MTL4_9PEZI|nr:hypothetical protein C8A05DRAFT_12113 [Staphylotrichum longicolle]